MPRSKKHSAYVIANWKMNPPSVGEAKKLFLDIKKSIARIPYAETVICPPTPFLTELRKLYLGHRIHFGVQNVHFKERGSFTGEVGSHMVKSIGAEYVILGHSERRDMGEDNETINKKVLSVISQDLFAVLCIGERERSRSGQYLEILEKELRSALRDVSQLALKYVLLTYEPIWAIGKTGKDSMKPHDVYETTLFLRKILSEMYDKKTALALPILYGGSVEAENSVPLLKGGGIQGFLVGHASLDVAEFSTILSTAAAR